MLNKRWINAISAIVAVLSVVSYYPFMTNPRYLFVIIPYALCVFVMTTLTVRKIIYSDSDSKEFLIVLFVGFVFAFLPAFSQSYMYGDDLWGFRQLDRDSITTGLYYSRPFLGFTLALLPQDIMFKMQIARFVLSIPMVLLGFLLYIEISSITNNKLWAKLVAGFVTFGVATADCIGYISVFPIFISLYLSLLAFSVYRHYSNSSRRIQGYFLVILLLFMAFSKYQIGTPLFLVMLYLYTIMAKKGIRDAFFENIKAALVYAISTLLYLFYNMIAQSLLGIHSGQSARGQIGMSVAFYSAKIKWFLSDVIPQTINKLAALFAGNTFFKENMMFYKCTYNINYVQIIIMLLWAVCLIYFIVRNHKICFNSLFVFLIYTVVMLVVSFWPFLALPESTYLTYYAMPIYIFMLIIFCCAISAVLEKLKESKSNFCVALVFLWIILQSNVYVEKVWVNYNRDSYEYIANTLLTYDEETLRSSNKIAVYGNLGPFVGGREYVIFCIQDVLSEIGVDYINYDILQLDNSNYVSIINDAEMEELYSKISVEEQELLMECYIYDEMYSRWLWAGKQVSEDDLSVIKNVLETNDFLPNENSEYIYIDLRGYNKRNRL